MRIMEMTFHRAATVNLGNFNSAKVEFSATVEVQDGEDKDACFARLSEWVNKKVRDEIKSNGGS